MPTRRLAPILGLAALCSVPARAETTLVDLTDLGLIDFANTTALWDTSQGRILGAIAPGGSAAQVVDFGTAGDGAFRNGASASGISTVGAVTTIDTSVRSTFEFRSFQLDAGQTLRAIGSNPLVIRVHGAATIAGTIDLTGSIGEDNGNPGPGAQKLTVTAGGAAGAGGGTGGNGGPGSSSGTPPTAGGIAGKGGDGGLNSSTSALETAGGGGCNGNDATPGSGGSTSQGFCGGQTQTQIGDAFTNSNFTAGGGGGGGGACNGGTCTGQLSGSGGGGGGGAIRLSAVGNIDVTASGVINVSGGTGGLNNADAGASSADCGGAGGGGGGGSIWLQSAGTITLNGAATRTGGLGGVPTNPNCLAGVFEGGNGGLGILRADAPVDPNIGESSFALTVPAVTYVAVSKPLPLFANGYMELQSVTATACAASTLPTVELEGSDDGVNYSAAIPIASAAQLSTTRFIRFVTTITASTQCLQQLEIQYVPQTLGELQLTGGLFFCGRLSSRDDSGPGGNGGFPLYVGNLTILLIAITSPFWLRSKQRTPATS